MRKDRIDKFFSLIENYKITEDEMHELADVIKGFNI